VAQALPNRSKSAIYEHCKRVFTPAVEGPWTADEEKSLLELIDEFGTKWQEIAKILGRTGRGVQAKYRDMSRNVGKFTPEEDDLLIQLVQELHPGPKPPHKNIMWHAIAKRLGRTERACRERYYSTLYAQLISGYQRNPFTDDDDQELMRKIYEQGAEDESEVNWDLVATPKFHAAKCRKRFNELVRRIPGYHTKSLDDLLTTCVEIYRAKNEELSEQRKKDETRKKICERSDQKSKEVNGREKRVTRAEYQKEGLAKEGC